MKKIMILTVLIASFFLASPVHGEDVAGKSATITYSESTNACSAPEKVDYAKKKLAIKTVLERYNSPLSKNVDDFIATCSKYGIDCYLLPSIAGLESSFGTFFSPNSNNGWGWGGGLIKFNSWAEGMDAVGSGLKYNYMNKGANSLDQIGTIYSESPTWSIRVNKFMNEFKTEEAKLSQLTPQNKDGVL